MSQFGKLPVISPLPADIPPLGLPGWLSAMVLSRTPARLRWEMRHVAGGVSLDTVYAYNLHYELCGLGCITAAVPQRNRYRFYRRLDWPVGFCPVFSFAALENTKLGTYVRYTPGFVGALSGCTSEWCVAMNMSPESHMGIRMAGRPMAWILREALARGENYQKTKHWLLQQEPIRQAFVVLVAPKQACWLLVGGRVTCVLKEVVYPQPLVVGNAMSESTLYAPEWRSVGMAPFQGSDGFVLDRYTKVF